MTKPRGETANTEDNFRTFIGQSLRGYFRKDGDSYLIFEDGRALVLRHATGAHWVATANEVTRELNIVARQLKQHTDALSNVLTLAGRADVIPAHRPHRRVNEG